MNGPSLIVNANDDNYGFIYQESCMYEGTFGLQIDSTPVLKEEEPGKDNKEGVLIESQGETFVHKPAESLAQKLEVCYAGSLSFLSSMSCVFTSECW